MNERIVKKSFMFCMLSVAAVMVPLFFFSCNPQINNTAIGANGRSNVTLAVGKSIPATINSAEITVEGEGMETLAQSIEVGDTSLTLEIPAGEARTFSMTMSNDTATFSGSVTQDLVAGEEMAINIPLELSATKIVVPDADFYGESNGEGGRIVQMDDMTGAGWVEKDWDDFSSFGYIIKADFVPYDVDFDDKGRIYIANNTTSDGMGGIIRLDDINDTSPEAVVEGVNIPVPSLAVDRPNGYIYYFTADSKLHRYDIYNESVYTYDSLAVPTSIVKPGITVDDNGVVYISYYSETPIIHKFNPENDETSYAVSYTSVLDPQDVIYKNGYIYVAEGTGASTPQIIKLTKNLSLEGSPLSEDPDNASDTFHGPSLFLAVVSDKIYVIDEGGISESDTENRLVSFDDISGTGWETYQKDDTADDFSFFYFC